MTYGSPVGHAYLHRPWAVRSRPLVPSRPTAPVSHLNLVIPVRADLAPPSAAGRARPASWLIREDHQLRRLPAGVLLLVPATFLTWAFRPGYMNADTLIQYDTAQGAPIDDWYAPVIQLLWRAAFEIGVGRPTFVLFAQCLAMSVGMFLILRAAVGRGTAAGLTIVIIALPMVFAQVMLVGRDMWLVAFGLLHVGCLIRWRGCPTSGWRRHLWLAVALVSAVLAIWTRQNAAAMVVVPCATMFARILRPNAPASRVSLRRLARGVGAVALAVAFCLCGLASARAIQRAAGVSDAQPEALLYAYDLAGASIRLDRNLFGPLAFPKDDLAELRAHWSPDDVVPLVLPPDEPTLRAGRPDPATLEELEASWRDLLREHTGTYLQVRGSLFLRLIGVDAPASWVMHLGVDSNRFGFTLANPGANDALRTYVAWFSPGLDFEHGSWIFRPWPYLLLGLAVAIALVKRRRRTEPDGFVAAFLAGGLLYELSFFFLAPGHGYRYSYPAIVAALVGAVYLCGRVVSDRRSAGDARDAEQVEPERDPDPLLERATEPDPRAVPQ